MTAEKAHPDSARPGRPASDHEVREAWEQHWQAPDAGRLTPVGYLITRGKRRNLTKVLATVSPGSAIEVGCGMGHTLQVLGQALPQAVGIDFSEAAVAACRKRGLNVRHQRVEDVNDSYDLVFSDGLLEHFPDFEPYAHHLARTSNKHVLLAQTDHDSPVAKLLLFLERLFRPGKNVPERDYRIGEFVASFQKAGFELVSVKPVFFGAFKMLLFQRKGG